MLSVPPPPNVMSGGNGPVPRLLGIPIPGSLAQAYLSILRTLLSLDRQVIGDGFHIVNALRSLYRFINHRLAVEKTA